MPLDRWFGLRPLWCDMMGLMVGHKRKPAIFSLYILTSSPSLKKMQFHICQMWINLSVVCSSKVEGNPREKVETKIKMADDSLQRKTVLYFIHINGYSSYVSNIIWQWVQFLNQHFALLSFHKFSNSLLLSVCWCLLKFWVDSATHLMNKHFLHWHYFCSCLFAFHPCVLIVPNSFISSWSDISHGFAPLLCSKPVPDLSMYVCVDLQWESPPLLGCDDFE